MKDTSCSKIGSLEPINNLKIISYSSINFKEYWESFLKDYKIYSYKYNYEVLQYYELISKDCLNESFIVNNQNSILAICPLIIEKINNIFQGSIYKGSESIPAALFNKNLTKKQKNVIEKILFSNVLSIFKKLDVKRSFFQIDTTSDELCNIFDLYLDKVGALDVSSFHRILDLDNNEEDLWKFFRKSSKSIINKGLKTFEFKVYDSKNFTDEIGELHRKFHHEVSGKITRPIESFKKMASWVKSDKAVLIEQRYQNQIAQMAYVAIGGKSASIASIAENLKSKPPIPMTHSLNFFAYMEMKKRGIKFYDTGSTSYRSTIFNILTKKELNINFFKRSFSMNNIPIRFWIWFKNKEEEIKYLKEKILIYEKFNF